MADVEASPWRPDGEEARNLRRRAGGLWNADYVEHVLLPLLQVPDGGRVVDVGTGLGALAFLLAAQRPDLDITGIDPEAGLIAEAQAAAVRGDRIRFAVGDGAALPFADRSMDLAMCQTVLTHAPAAQAVVGEMARVLRPGGTFLAVEWTDAALTALDYDTTAAAELEEATAMFRLTRAHGLGRARRGRGDDLAGILAPILAVEAGLDVVDVRLNDRIPWAVPPYADERQRDLIDEARAWAAADPGEDGRAEIVANLVAGGLDAAEADRAFVLAQRRRKRKRWRTAIADGRLAFVRPNVMILTIARRIHDQVDGRS